MNPDTFDLWWSRVSRILMFLGGMAIMGWETVVDHGDRQWLILGAVSMMVPAFAQSLRGLLVKLVAPEAPEAPGSISPLTGSGAPRSSSAGGLIPSPGTPNGHPHQPPAASGEAEP
jgi:hypothetical protein